MAETREVIVEGTPRSLQASARGRDAWKKTVIAAARQDISDDEGSIAYVDVGVQILHFCPTWEDTEGDLDNIAKPILDALCESHRVLFNDNQVKEIFTSTRRVEADRRRACRASNATSRQPPGPRDSG